ncbi:PhpK family radical SAM P-methyltransferase [Ruminiclostridium cellobioparum]|uniref:PhpK family radical SAM P-methyltransferase n=1 Tax=Ruminiclostridium cellobioparum TaxID=29355 RepID=UPI000685C15F|nr:PhpK family radical SAM P-methyltransferase [Ruminiclostridium cellobioparum]
MAQSIDCLIIGHNQMKFCDYEGMVGSMGKESEPYQDLNLNFVRYNSEAITAAETFNTFYKRAGNNKDIINLGELFSATIAYLGTYIKRRGFTFDYVNSFQDEKEELAKKLRENNVLTIAITTTLYVSSYPISEIISFVRQYNTTAKIIVGGPFVSTNARTQNEVTMEYILCSLDADFYINSSQGEFALVQIINAVKNGLQFNQISNIYFKQKSGYIRNNIEIENNILAENMVDWSLFGDRVGRFATIRTAISCPFSCSFCGFPQHAGKYQTVDVETIEKEWRALDSIGTVKSIYIIDDTFNVPRDRFKDILKMMIKNRFSFKWHSYFRCQFADEEIISLMKESGCEGVFLGIESGSQEILNNMSKASTIEKYREGMKLLREYGIIINASFIIGFPGETYKTVQETVRFIEDTRPDFYRAQLWYCEPITPIWKEKEKYGIKGSQFKWSHKTMDSKTGSKLVNEVFLSVKNSIWMPQYNFDSASIFPLMQNGININQIKEFMSCFQEGIAEKLKSPNQKNISLELEKRMEAVFKAAK